MGGEGDELVNRQTLARVAVDSAQEISELKEAGRRIDHLNRVLEAVRTVNQLIIREPDPGALVARACRLLVESRGYTNAWILLREGPLGAARVVEEGLGEDFRPLERQLLRGRLPLCCQDALERTAVITREPFTCGDCLLSEMHQPKEVMTVRLNNAGTTFGFICVSMPGEFTGLEEERQLFQDVANDLAFALNRTVLQQERDRAVQRRVELSRKILLAQEEERVRLSRELHDELGQILTAVHYELELLDPSSSAPGLRKADAMVTDAMSKLRRICRGLRPPMLDDLGLAPAVRGLVEEFKERMKIAVQLQLPEGGERIPTEIAVCVFRVLQEALNNAARHSGAARVSIVLAGEDGDLVLRIEDDGSGFVLDDPAATRGCGLQGMRERADLVEATLELTSVPGEGTHVCLRVPSARERAR
jgi:signal transduction histidine kinase